MLTIPPLGSSAAYSVSRASTIPAATTAEPPIQYGCRAVQLLVMSMCSGLRAPRAWPSRSSMMAINTMATPTSRALPILRLCR